jgi:hypothetical protein
VTTAFVSSSQACQQLRQSATACRFFWVPEGIDAGRYRYAPYAGKNIDVLHFGRRYEAYHQAVRHQLERDGKVYLYERTPSRLVFADRAGFVDGLARAKISVCVPCSITHPPRAMGIETMTLRYLQSIASKCLTVGHAPRELIAAFGYNPVIEIDYADPAGQLRWILNNFHDFVPLIERNHSHLGEHTWTQRWHHMRALMNTRSTNIETFSCRQRINSSAALRHPRAARGRE